MFPDAVRGVNNLAQPKPTQHNSNTATATITTTTTTTGGVCLDEGDPLPQSSCFPFRPPLVNTALIVGVRGEPGSRGRNTMGGEHVSLELLVFALCFFVGEHTQHTRGHNSGDSLRGAPLVAGPSQTERSACRASFRSCCGSLSRPGGCSVLGVHTPTPLL